ncbi:FHA domain-containing protein [Alkalinema pantanalense CENA528]|uniref:FHA domain-containing protein n=1 Tax=Alkalinema pantanalense TaxID=1620705 RepID=UPI003D6E6BDF
MSLDPHSPDIFLSPFDSASLNLDALVSEIEVLASGQATRSENLDGLDDSDEVLSHQIATFVMDDGNDQPNSDLTSYHSDVARPKYVQGVLRGQQAYLITNLLGEGSRTLIQPQMVWTIGRNREAAVPMRDRMMSRRHAVLMFTRREGFYLIDLNSMNGSFVNGVKVENRCLLKDGDFLRVGNTEFFFFVSGSYRSLEALHPEVLTRLTHPTTKASAYVDYSEIHEEISFNLNPN